jgi:hypothetical protein
LIGKQNAFPFQGSESGLSARVGLLVKLFSRGACHLYFTNRALTGNESLSPLLTPEADCVATCPSQLSRQTFFTDRTLAGNPNAFPLLRLDSARRFRRPSCQQRLYSHGARHLYFTNRTLTGSRVPRLSNGALSGLIAQEPPSSRGFLTAKKFRTTKCAL